ncbi:MAG: hypothetical protein P8R42_08130 [Candidatus Binatia bacterium]|nr:hypothetical protein [Candidatus Binatia bacterium]
MSDPGAATIDAAAESKPPKDASPLGLVFLRDLTLLIVIFSIWAGAEAWAEASGLGFAVVLSALGGLLAGAAGVSLLHEWGHFAAARLSGAVAPISPAKNMVPLFQFDLERSSDQQFVAMSVGGNVAHWVGALGLFFALPSTSAGLTAVQAGAFGFVAFASVIEVPIIRRASRSGIQAFRDFVKDSSYVVPRAARVGLGTALAVFLLL